MSEPSQKCENNAIFKQNYTKKLLISFKISYSCCFGFRGNLEFPDFLQKSFITSTTGPMTFPFCYSPTHGVVILKIKPV